MEFKNRDVYELYLKCTQNFAKNSSRLQKCNEDASKFIAEHAPSADHNLVRRKLECMIESRPGNKATPSQLKLWEDSTFFVYDESASSVSQPPPDDEKPPKKKGRPSLVLGDEPCKKLHRSMMRDMVLAIEEFAAKHKLTKEEALQMTVDECNRTWHSSVDTR